MPSPPSFGIRRFFRHQRGIVLSPALCHFLRSVLAVFVVFAPVGHVDFGFATTNTPISDTAFPLILQRTFTNRQAFFVYRDQDSAANHGFPSGLFGLSDVTIQKIHLDTGCIDDPLSTSGCSTNMNVLDRQRGNVIRVAFDPLVSGEFAGVNFEDPEGWGVSGAGRGYDLTGATQLVVSVRCPTPGGISIQFGVAGNVFPFYFIPQTTNYQTIAFSLSSIPASALTNAHIVFSLAVSVDWPPSSGTLLIDWVQFLPVPSSHTNVLGFPLATETFGVVPRSYASTNRQPWPLDQVLRNVSTLYESSLAALALLDRGRSNDLAAAKIILDTFVYAQTNDNHGDLLPATNGWAGLHNGYMAGDLPLFNAQGPGMGQQGDVRLGGFSVTNVPPTFYLVLDGSTGGNVSFGILAMCSGYKKFNDPRYLDAARSMAQWIIYYLKDTATTNFGGYYLGYPDEGSPKVLVPSKSTENNADIWAALSNLAELERQLGNNANMAKWTTNANEAGDFVMRMFDPVLGRFYAGTGPLGTTQSDGVMPNGPKMGSEVVNTYDFLDTQSFTTLALAESPRYRNQIDWRRPVQYITNQFAQTISAGGRAYNGFNIVKVPMAGPNGIAWEFTGQAVLTMNFVNNLYGQMVFAPAATFYLAQIRSAQTNAPFGDSLGLVASTVQDGDTLVPLEQCLSTPFQAIPERVGLAATTWAIFAERDFNPLSPDIAFRIKSVNIVGGGVMMNFSTLAGHTYQIQWSTNLNTWNTLLDNVPGTGADVEATDPLQVIGQRFYRVRLNP